MAAGVGVVSILIALAVPGRLVGLAGSLAEILARTFVDDDGGDGRQRFALFAGE